MNPRINDRLSWYDSFMLHAFISAERSPDPNTQVGVCLVNPETNKILSTGYNGFPKGISPKSLSWERTSESPLDTKYPYIVHAEKNAINNAKVDLSGAYLFSTMHPCNECAKDIIQANIKKVFYMENKYPNAWETQAAVKLFQLVDIPCIQYEWHDTMKVLQAVKHVLARFS